jgi:hypothetical protein
LCVYVELICDSDWPAPSELLANNVDSKLHSRIKDNGFVLNFYGELKVSPKISASFSVGVAITKNVE